MKPALGWIKDKVKGAKGAARAGAGHNPLGPLWAEHRFLVIAVSVVLGLALLIGVVLWQYNAWVEERREASLTRVAMSIGHEMGGVLVATFDEVDAALDLEALALEVSEAGSSAIEAALARAVEANPALTAARFVELGTDAVDRSGVPPIGYAVLDMLRRTEESGQAVPPEVLFLGSEQELVASVRPLRDGEELIGHVLTSLDVAILKKASAVAVPPGSYAELQQAVRGSKSITLARAGDPSARQGFPGMIRKVHSTSWRVSLWQPASDAGQNIGTYAWGGWAALAALLLVAAGWGEYKKYRQARQVAVFDGAAANPLQQSDVDLPVPKVPAAAADLAGTVPPPPPPPPDDLGGLIVEEHEGDLPLPGSDAGGSEPPPVPSIDDAGSALDEAAAPGAEQDGTPAPVPSSGGSIDGLPPAAVYRAYDVRGIIGEDFGSEQFKLLGQAIGSEAFDRGQQTIVVARDGRLSSPQLHQAVVQGLKESGRDVIDIGLAPTPVLYFATHYLNTGSGVMVTASHNPRDYNGLKVVLAGETLFDEDIAALGTRIESGNFQIGEGNVQEMDLLSEYIRRVSEDVPVALGNAFRLVLDCGNGVAGTVAPKLFRALGHDVVELYCEVDGAFPNHDPDTSDPSNLQDLVAAVKEHEADLGLAFDGDGDRLAVVDSNGSIVYPDRLMMLYARDILSRNPGGKIIFDVKCTSRLGVIISKLGGTPIMWKTGHSFLKNKLHEEGAELAGDLSGHIFFSERWYGFDDGMYAAARLIEILMQIKQPPADILAKLPSGIATPEIRVDFPEGEHLAFMSQWAGSAAFDDAAVSTIDGIRADFKDGWGLVRASNTTPALTLRFEAHNEEALARIQGQFKETLLAVKPELELPF